MKNDGGEFSSETKNSAIQALGFISEEMTALLDDGSFEMDKQDCNDILAAIVQGVFEKGGRRMEN